MIEGIANLVAFFEGGVSYRELRDMPLPELERLHVEAKRIEAARKARK